MQPIVPNLWFDGNAEEAARFYTSLFDDGRVVAVTPYGPATPGPEGTVMSVEWEMQGRRYLGINGGPMFTFSEAVSFELRCDDQAEIDRYWGALTEGGEPGPCGWCKDRFGLSWQVTPNVLFAMLADPDAAKVGRATQYFLGLDKVPFDLAALTAAYEGREA